MLLLVRLPNSISKLRGQLGKPNLKTSVRLMLSLWQRNGSQSPLVQSVGNSSEEAVVYFTVSVFF